MKTTKTATIKVYLKTKKDDGENESFGLKNFPLPKAKKIYRKLIKMWNTKKCVQLGTHYFAVASDLIYAIIMEG